MNRMDEWLTAPCWIVDILPERVPESSPGQYFAVEEYFLRDPSLRKKQLNILLKLNCYYDLTLVTEDEEIRNPAPAVWAEKTGREDLNVFVGKQALMTADHTDTWMTVYTADEKLPAMIRDLAAAEGMFVWMGQCGS